MVRNLARLRRRLSPRLALDHDVEVDELLGERGNVVREAKGVLADGVRGEHEVALALARAGEDVLRGGVGDLVVDLEGATGLDGEVKLRKGVSINVSKEGGERTPIFSPALSTSA